MNSFALPMAAFTFAETAHYTLQSGVRLLLMVAMTLFLSYLMFMVSAIVVSSLAGLARSGRQEIARASREAIPSTLKLSPSLDVDPARDLHRLGA